MKNILIINQPLNNRGDESAHRALVRELSKTKPHYKINVLFFNQPENSINEFKVDYPNVRYIGVQTPRPSRIMRKLNKYLMDKYILRGKLKPLFYIIPHLRSLLMHIKRADIIVNAPGGICMGGFQNWGHIKLLLLAKKLHKPIFYYGRSIGPFPIVSEENKRFREYSIELLNYFSFLSLRDKKSEAIARELNIDFTSTVDTAFLETPVAEIPSEIAKSLDNTKYVVFVPNLLIWHYAYRGKVSKSEILDFYVKLANAILDNRPDHKIVFLPQTCHYGYPADDIHLFREIVEKLERKQRAIIISDKYGSDIQQTIIRNARLMIGARYHSIVFALNNAVPFIALSYEHKIEGLLMTLNKTSSMIDISTKMLTDTGRGEIINNCIDLMNSPTDRDKTARDKAKQIARNSFNKFISSIE